METGLYLEDRAEKGYFFVSYLNEPKKKARAQLIIKDYIRLTPRNGRYSEEIKQQKLKFEEEFFKIE